MEQIKEKKKTRCENKNKRWLYWIIGVLVAVIIVMICSGYVLLQRVVLLPDTDADTLADQYNLYEGSIEGSLSYPSDYIPPLQICAQNTRTKETICTLEMIRGAKYVHGYGYSLDVPAGAYHVYAQTVDDNGNPESEQRSYYSQFVLCGMEHECPSHTPIVVKVEGGEALNAIDPMDWYDYL